MKIMEKMKNNLEKNRKLRLEREMKYNRNGDIKLYGFSPADVDCKPAGGTFDQIRMVCGSKIKLDDYVDWILDDKYTFVDIELIYCMFIENDTVKYISLKKLLDIDLKTIPLKIVNASTGVNWNGRYFNYECSFYNDKPIDGVIGLYSEVEEYSEAVKPRQLVAYDKTIILAFQERNKKALSKLDGFFELYEEHERKIIASYIEKFDKEVRKKR